MKSNFDFLNRYWPALAQIGATAETYVYSDPNACIYKLGMFAERLVQEILVFEHIAEPAVDNTHANRIRILKRAGLLPHEIDNTLYVLRKTRNSAVHIGTDSVDEAKTLLSLTYNLAVWFMETYGDWGYIAPEFVMPSETTHEDLESVIAEQERKIEELTKQLAVVKTAASGKTQKERAKRSESVSAMMNWNETQTRCLIDEQLRLSGWEADAQNLRYSKGTRPVKGRNIAISEWPTNSAFSKNGYADYAFFVGEKLVALMDAKKMSEDVASTIDVQVKDYAAHIKPEDIPHTVGNWNGYQVPFLFASNGRAYLEQLRTKSGIWFLDVREQENQPYPIRNWFSPSDLMEKLGQNTAAANQALAAADNSFMTDPNGLNLRDYQIKAIDKATEAIVDGRAAYTRTLPVSELFELDPTDAGQNDTHKKQNIIKAVKDAHTKITAMQTAMKNASDDEKMILCEEANEVYQACLKTVSRNVANDHILCMLIDEIDHPDKSKYDIKSARHLLFASLLYEDSRRLLSKLKTVEDFAPYDLIRVEPELVPEGYRTEWIYGFPHAHLLIK